LNLAGGASAIDILGATTLKNNYLGGGVFASPTVDISTHGAMYAGTQPLTLATQAGILGVNALGENLLDMQIKTISDARNFMVGVNNVASVFSENSGLLKSIESASVIAMNHGRLMTEAMDRIDMSSMTRGIELATEYHLKANEVFKLSESVTTVLAYGQAVQNQFDIITGSELFKNGATVLITGLLIITLQTARKSSKLLRMEKKKKFGLETISSITNGKHSELKRTVILNLSLLRKNFRRETTRLL
jgi:hypothetical protein